MMEMLLAGLKFKIESYEEADKFEIEAKEMLKNAQSNLNEARKEFVRDIDIIRKKSISVQEVKKG